MIQLIVVVLLACSGSVRGKERYEDVLTSPRKLLHLFNQYQISNHLSFSGREAAIRLRMFRKSVSFINEQNSRDVGWEVGVNKFSVMSAGERAQYLGLNTTGRVVQNTAVPTLPDLDANRAQTAPEAVNWIAAGAVTKAKDQARCGSCWTFGSTCSIEGAYQIATGKLKSFSEQELLDCVYKMRNGCTGGFNSDAIEFVQQHGHLATRRTLPYTARDTSLGECDLSRWTNGLQAATVTSMISVGPTELDSVNRLAKGPLATSVDVTKNFFYYKAGVLRDTACTPISLSHAIAIVAYNPQWFLVKNSWGDDWGLEGFIKLARGHHNCGTWIHPFQPVMTVLSSATDTDPEDDPATFDPDKEITTAPPTEVPCVDDYPRCNKNMCQNTWKKWCRKFCGLC